MTPRHSLFHALVLAPLICIFSANPSSSEGLIDLSLHMDRLFASRSFRGAHAAIPYRIAVLHRSKSELLPLILFLHGSDERGIDNTRQMYMGLNILVATIERSRRPCVIVAPQCPSAMRWVDADWKAEEHRMKKQPAPPLATAVELVRSLIKERLVDPARCYVVGYSMGGFGAWESIQRWPCLFAAAVPVCGGGDERLAERAARAAVWAFHGAKDTIVKVTRSRRMVQAIVAAGGVPRYTEYADIGHGSWGLAFANPALVEWLFRQRLSPLSAGGCL